MLSRRYVAICTLVLLVGMVLVGPVSGEYLYIYPDDAPLKNETLTTFNAKITGPDGTIDNTSTTITIGISTTGNASEWKNIYRGAMLFATGDALSANYSTIILHDATLRGRFGAAYSNSFSSPAAVSLIGFTPGSTVVIPTDYGRNGTVRFSDDKPNSTITGSAYFVYELNSDGLAAIKTGAAEYTGLMLAINSTVDSTEPAWESAKSSYVSVYSTKQSGTNYDPYLKLNFTGYNVPTSAFSADDTTPVVGQTVTVIAKSRKAV